MRQCAKRTMGRRVAVTAHNGHAGQGPALLWANDMHDALTHVRDRIIMHAEFLGVFIQRFDLNAALFVVDALGAIQSGRYVVIWHSDGLFWRAHFTARHTQTFKGLWAGHFVDQMAVDIQQAGAVFGFMGDMSVPDFVIECFGGHGSSPY